jgi:uncharacterized membrane protein
MTVAGRWAMVLLYPYAYPGLTPGPSALFLLSSDAVQDRVREEFQGVQAELISTNLSVEQEDKLREAFATED